MKKLVLSMSILLFSGVVQAQSTGALQVNGEAGRFQLFQKVKAVRCSLDQRGTCDAPVYFNLNKAQAVPVGSYLVGFENSLYPGLVKVEYGRTTTLVLDKVVVPSQVKGQKIRIYRDFTSLVEQKKIYLEMFMMNRHFFRLDNANFGDLYLAGSWERDIVQRFTYELCPKLRELGDVSLKAKTVCQAWNTAQVPTDLRELYSFGNDGTFEEMWVTFPGDVIPSKHPRYLVSAPLGERDFVAVFPGAYRVQAEGKKATAYSVRSASLAQIERSSGFSLNRFKTFISLDGEDCSSARVWKTDSRAYCTSDQHEGCDRSSAEKCEAM